MSAVRRATRGLTVADIAGLTSSQLGAGSPSDRLISNIAALDTAGAADICCVDDPKYLQELAETRAGACLIAPRLAASAPVRVTVLLNKDPYRAFITVARALFPETLRPSSLFGGTGRAEGARIHPSARIEANVTVDPLAVIGPRAEVGTGTVIAPGAVIGPDACVGRHCAVGAGATVLNALIGDRVIIHAGARLGHDASVYLGDVPGVEKIPQTRRVIIQDDADIGANAAIDRGTIRDTVVGERTKVGSLAHVARGATIGRHCFVGAQSGIAGGVTIGDFVVISERVGVAEELTIGDGATVTCGIMVNADIARVAQSAGTPQHQGADNERRKR